MWKSKVGLAAAILMSLGLASGATAQEKTLTLITISGGDKTAMQAVADAFEKSHPGVKIKIQDYPFVQFFQVAELRLRSKDAALDLVYTDVPLIAAYASKGYLEPLDAAVPSAEAEKIWVKTAVEAGTYDGKLMAMPINSSTQVMFYNPALFQKAGLTPPVGLVKGESKTQAQVDEIAEKSRWTWEQVADAAKKLTIKEGGKTVQYGFSFEQFGELYQLQPLGESVGTAVISPDGFSAKGYLDSDAWKKGAQFWHALFNEWQVSPKNLGYGQGAELFGNGQLAMFVGGTWDVPIIEKTGVEFGVAPFPVFQGGTVLTPTGSWYMAVSAFSGNKPEAIEFAKFLTESDEGTRIWYKEINQLPTTKALLEEIATSPDYDTFPNDVMRLGVYEAYHTARPRPVTPAYGQLQDAFRTAFVDMSNGIAVDQALASAVQKFDAAAARMKR